MPLPALKSTVSFLTILICFSPSLIGRSESGELSTAFTVWLSTFFHSFTVPKNALATDTESSPRWRFMLQTTSSAVSGDPSWNSTPLRILKVYSVALLLTDHSSASSGARAMLSRIWIRPL